MNKNNEINSVNKNHTIMKKAYIVILLMAVCANVSVAAPRANIIYQNVTPYQLSLNTLLTSDSTVASGNNVIARGTYMYVNCTNFGDATAITSATWTLQSKPAGSNASISSITGLQWWARFRTDSTGTYVVHLTMVTSSGSVDTTANVYVSTYVGTGGFANIPPAYPNCMSCHQYMSEFVDIFNRWKVSGHGTSFSVYIDSGSTSFGTNCFPCHTEGYNHNLKVDNNGFDDVAARLGWVWSNYSPPKPGNWDTLRTRFPGLVPFAGIGCENCHGPGSEHVAAGGDTNKIARNYSAAVCGQCHDSPPHEPYFRQWSNALHSKVIWNSSFAQQPSSPDFETNDLGNCIRCHDALGYINFTRGVGTDTRNLSLASQHFISCQGCHDQHGNSNAHYLRNRPLNTDTLANGFHYSLGEGQTCADCHKSRQDVRTYVNTRVTSANWGPHHGPQTDVLLGKSAATFNGIPYVSGSHGSVNPNACVDCHMHATDTSAAVINKVGGHSLNMRNDSLNYDFVAPCQSCHPGKNRFSDFMAPQDFDGNGQIQDWETEINGCIRNLRIALPPAGVDSVSWSLIAADSNNVNLRKAYWNYLLITSDNSNGIHNPFFTVNVLLASVANVIGIEYQWTEVPKVFSLSQNFPNPFNPTTKFTFSIPKTQQVTIKIYDIMGREVKTLVNSNISIGKYTVDWDGTNGRGSSVSSGVYFYRMETAGFIDVKKMVLVR